MENYDHPTSAAASAAGSLTRARSTGIPRNSLAFFSPSFFFNEKMFLAALSKKGGGGGIDRGEKKIFFSFPVQ